MTRRRLILPELLAHFGNEVRKAGSQRQWAIDNGVHQPRVNEVLAGKREPNEQILAVLGYRKTTLYEPVEE